MHHLKEEGRIPYSCPKCGLIPSPMLYQPDTTYYKSNHSCYLMMDGRLVVPVVKMKPIPCCDGYYVAPYHPTVKEYIEEVRPYFAFFVSCTPWVESWIRDEASQANIKKYSEKLSA